MSSKIIVIDDVEYEPHPPIDFVYCCKLCWFRNKKECNDVPSLKKTAFIYLKNYKLWQDLNVIMKF